MTPPAQPISTVPVRPSPHSHLRPPSTTPPPEKKPGDFDRHIGLPPSQAICPCAVKRPPLRDLPPPCVTFRLVVAPLRGPRQSPVLPFACCVGLLLSVGRCGRCSCCPPPPPRPSVLYPTCTARGRYCLNTSGCGKLKAFGRRRMPNGVHIARQAVHRRPVAVLRGQNACSLPHPGTLKAYHDTRG